MALNGARLERGRHEQAAARLLRDLAIPYHTRDLELLGQIAQRFSKLPYENVSKIIKLSQAEELAPLRLPEEIYEDFRDWNLGGTCFSLTFYLLEILTYCGYEAYPVMGDMRWGENVHCAILVNRGGHHYLVDPGYMVHQPLELSKDTIKRHMTPHSGIAVRFDPMVERFDLYTFRRGNWTWRYRFSPWPVSIEEFAQHWIESFYKPTMHGVCLTKVAGSEMVYVHNHFTKISGYNRVQRHNSQERAEQTVREQFEIPLHLLEEARYALEINRRRGRERGSDAAR